MEINTREDTYCIICKYWVGKKLKLISYLVELKFQMKMGYVLFLLKITFVKGQAVVGNLKEHCYILKNERRIDYGNNYR